MSDAKLILLAEDSPQDVEMTLTALSEHKLLNEIAVVNDGAQALDFLYCRGPYAARSSGNPVLVLLDLKMPKVDGLEVLRTIKNDDRLRSIPVVMLTSSREEQDIIRSYELGINAYVVKPVDFHSFIEAVKNLGTFWILLNEAVPQQGSAHPWRRPAARL
jgi:CheY-like chemotaxis protein